MPVTQILQKASDLAAARGEQIVFLGDGASAYKQEIDAAVTEGITYRYAPAHMNRQRAAATAALAYLRWQEQGEACFVSADDFRPDYMKASQAEREKAYAQQTGQMDALAAGTLLSGGKK